ncbi:MAG TPA: DUF1294 domain-containing protein [Pasteurellaceae bacterium]|nr:DUF1294 domain-containing protein [Pasteurellaceae bacterium]
MHDLEILRLLLARGLYQYWPFVLIYVAGINILTYVLMYHDKQRAMNNQWRISEKTLLNLTVFGGFVGMYLGMQHFRHKTKHLSFKITAIVAPLLWFVGLLSLY